MSKWVKLIALTLIIGMLALAVGCSSPSSTPSGSKEAPKEATFPKEPIHVIVPMKAGGSTDMVARAIQPYFAKYVGASVVVENVEGGGGKIGVSQVYKANPSGYQLLLGVFPAWLLTQRIDKTADYDVTKMIPIYNISGKDYNAIAVPYDSPIKTLNDFIEASKKKSLKVSGSGLGTNSFLAFVLLKDIIKANVDYIPYNSGSEAVLAVVGKHVDASVGSVISFKPQADDKKVRIIATFGPDRAEAFPDVPSIAEAGFPQAAFDITLGIMAPPGVPSDVVAKLEAAMEKAVNDPEFQAAAKKANIGIAPMNSAEYKKSIEQADKIIVENLEALIAGSAPAKK